MLAGLPQEVEEYVIPADETCGVCGAKMKVTGKRIVRTEVEFSPAKLIVKQIVQQVAKCTKCEEPFPESCHSGTATGTFDLHIVHGCSLILRGAFANGVLYTLVESARANELDVYEYLKYLLTEMPNNHHLEDPSVIDSLLPWSKELPEQCH